MAGSQPSEKRFSVLTTIHWAYRLISCPVRAELTFRFACTPRWPPLSQPSPHLLFLALPLTPGPASPSQQVRVQAQTSARHSPELSLIFAHVTLEVMGRGAAWTSAVASAQVFLSLLQLLDGTCEHLSQQVAPLLRALLRSTSVRVMVQVHRLLHNPPSLTVSTTSTFSLSLQHARSSLLQGLCTGCVFCQDYSFYMVPFFNSGPCSNP